MTKDNTFRNYISDNHDELIIYAADNFSQFPLRDSSTPSKCDRALAAADSNDLVVLRGKLDSDYHEWLRSHGLGSDFVVEYGADTDEMTLSELIINNPEPVKEIIHKTGRKPVYVPWFSSQKEKEAADTLNADFFGSPETETFRYNDKAAFKIICQKLNIPVIEGVSFKMKPQDNENYSLMKTIVDGYLRKYKNVIIRGTIGESGMSLYKTNGSDIADIYKEISDCNEKVVLIEPFLNVSSSPNAQLIIDRDGKINHLGIRSQICKEGMIHMGTISELYISPTEFSYIKESSLEIAKKMQETGYTGVVGIDYVVSDEGVFPVENNARFNGSSYSLMIVERIEKLFYDIPVWKFMKIKSTPRSFIGLKESLKLSIFDGVKKQSIFPYNCELLQITGDFSVLLLAENMTQILELEKEMKNIEVSELVVV